MHAIVLATRDLPAVPFARLPVTETWTAKRVLETIAGAGLTLTRVESGEGCRWHLTTLPVLVKRVLGYLGLSNEVYTRLVINSG